MTKMLLPFTRTKKIVCSQTINTNMSANSSIVTDTHSVTCRSHKETETKKRHCIIECTLKYYIQKNINHYIL